MPIPDRTQPGVTMHELLDLARREAPRGPAGADAVTRLEYVVADIREVRAAERALQVELEDVLKEADREPRGDEAPRGRREKLVRTVQGAASRARVFEVLGAHDVESVAYPALRRSWGDCRGQWSLARLSGGRVALRAEGSVIDVQNEAPEILEALREAGLSLASTGPAVRLSEDLSRGHDVVLSLG